MSGVLPHSLRSNRGGRAVQIATHTVGIITVCLCERSATALVHGYDHCATTYETVHDEEGVKQKPSLQKQRRLSPGFCFRLVNEQFRLFSQPTQKVSFVSSRQDCTSSTVNCCRYVWSRERRRTSGFTSLCNKYTPAN